MEENPINLFNDSPEITTYKEQCDLLKMISIPSFGIYSNDYAFLEQILILKKNSCPNNLPQKAKNQINYLRNKYPEVKPEYFHITLSSEILFNISPENINSFSYTALNFISHPYIFYNCQLNREHKSDIFCAAYTDEQEIDTIKQENGDSHLRVNPECNMDDWQLKREVYIHLSDDNYPSLSPNNCHLLINLNSQFINFYVITCGTYHGKIVKIFVGNFVIIPNISNRFPGNLNQMRNNEGTEDDFAMNVNETLIDPYPNLDTNPFRQNGDYLNLAQNQEQINLLRIIADNLSSENQRGISH